MRRCPMPVAHPTRIGLKNILVAVDFSDCSKIAVPYAAALARHFGSKVWLAHVLEEEARIGIPLDSFPAEFDGARKDAERRMLRVLNGDAMKGMPFETVIGHGDVWPVLSNIIEKHEIEMLVLATHGRTGLKKLVLGSVAEEILRAAKIPTLVIGPNACHDGTPPKGEIKKIVYATDFEPASLAALPFALSLAQEEQAHLTLLHALEPTTADYTGDVERVAVYLRENLKGLLPADADLWCEPELVVEVGAPAETIAHVATYQHAELVIMGAKPVGATGVSAHSPWHTVHRVLVHAPCPVLTVRG